MQYGEFAKIYDILMKDTDYVGWVDYIIELFEKFCAKPKDILDLACGTGNVSILMSELGYNVSGVDISDSMLSIAENKARLKGQNIKFINQDITKLQINNTFDAIICACDGINYITKEEDLEELFHRIFNILRPNGIFIFDASSFYKLRYILGDNTFFEERENIYFSWENEFNDDNLLLTMVLNFFVPQGELYYRFEEIHRQRAYKTDFIIEKLLNTGFKNIEAFNGFSKEEPRFDSMRIFFAGIRP